MLKALDFFELELILKTKYSFHTKEEVYKGALHVYNDNSVVGYLEENGKITHMIVGVWVQLKGFALTIYSRHDGPSHFHVRVININDNFSLLEGHHGELKYDVPFKIKGECIAKINSVSNNDELRNAVIVKHTQEIKLVEEDNLDLYWFLEMHLEEDSIQEMVSTINKSYDLMKLGTIKFEKLSLEVNEENTGFIITSCDKDAINVTIPKEVNDMPIVKIGDKAFKDCVLLETIDFPSYTERDYYEDNVLKEIGNRAFDNCKKLKEVELPLYLYMVWDEAFNFCVSLEKVVINGSVFFGERAFNYCISLHTVIGIGDILPETFNRCSSLKNITFNDEIEIIGENAFTECSALTEFRIPASVKSIYKGAFAYCENLENVYFEKTSNWYYTDYDGEKFSIDVTDSSEIAYWLVETMTYDDDISSLERED